MLHTLVDNRGPRGQLWTIVDIMNTQGFLSVLATNRRTGERIALQITPINEKEPDMDKIHSDFVNKYGWNPDDTKIELGGPPPDMIPATLNITNLFTGKTETRKIYFNNKPSKEELERRLYEVKITFAVENGWDIKHTKVEYVMTVTVCMRATNIATGQCIPFQARTSQNPSEDTQVQFLEKIQNQIAEMYGWDVEATRIEYSEPPLDQPVYVYLRATNTATGQCIRFMTTTTDPDAVSALPDLQARFLIGIKSKFAETNGWDVGDTKIEYE